MIRINLVPQKASPSQIRGQQFLLVMFLTMALTGGALFYHYKFIIDLKPVEKNDAESTRLENDLKALNVRLSRIKILPVAEKQKIAARYNKKFQTVGRIEKVRSNPVFALLELSRILSVGQLPTVAPANVKQRMELDANWDPSPIFITKLSEKAREVDIKGYARTHYDLSELTRRLRVSEYFRRPEIVESKIEVDKSKDSGGMVDFTIRAQMVY
ncbi:PilN domain-containing protein [Myxococcota bacterium]|nr:PilN domain-containing protein [Myxococcota bacterium]MBU1379999.1 PilN domain-containing protein [Myxococcota bacterium]MBU1496756.1 PilN domain-containing protein [Myxococcota bacterium]